MRHQLVVPVPVLNLVPAVPARWKLPVHVQTCLTSARFGRPRSYTAAATAAAAAADAAAALQLSPVREMDGSREERNSKNL